MSSKREKTSPIGESHRDGMRRRSRRRTYREEAARIAPYEALARFVVRRRSQLGLTQADLAKRVGTSHSAISRIESGQHRTSVETLRRLAAALETHLVVAFHEHPERLEREPISTDAARGLELVTVS